MADLKFIGVNFPSVPSYRQADPAVDRLLVNTLGPSGAVGGPLVVSPVAAVTGTNLVLDVQNGSGTVLTVNGGGTTTSTRPWTNGTDHSWANSLSLDPSSAPGFGADGSVQLVIGSGVSPSAGSGTDGANNPAVGSLMLQTNGTAWLKTGAGATAWTELATASGSNLQVSYDAAPNPDIVQDASGGILISRGTSAEEYVFRTEATSLLSSNRAALETSLVGVSSGSALGVFAGAANPDSPFFVSRGADASLFYLDTDGILLTGTAPVAAFTLSAIQQPGAGTIVGTILNVNAGLGSNNVGAAGAGGDVEITAGQGGNSSALTGGAGGELRLRAGDGGTSTGAAGPVGGDLNIYSGSGGTGTSGGNGGSLLLQAGDGGSASALGGSVGIQVGTGLGANGSIEIGTDFSPAAIFSGTGATSWTHDGTFTISNSTNTVDALTVARTFAGAGEGIEITMATGTTGRGLRITMDAGSTGRALSVTVPSGSDAFFGTDGTNQVQIKPILLEMLGASARIQVPNGVDNDNNPLSFGSASYGLRRADLSGTDALYVSEAGSDEIALRAAAPSAVGRATAEGSELTLARSDHVHDTPIIIDEETATFDLLSTHDYVRITSGSAVTITLPNPGDVGPRRWHILLSHDAAGDVTLDRFGSEEIQGVAADYILRGAWSEWTLVCDGTDWWIFQSPETLTVKKAADETLTSTGALQDDDELFLSVAAGRKYTFRICAFVNVESATPGILVAPGGTATMTSFKAQVLAWDSSAALVAAERASVLGSSIALAIGDAYVTMEGSFEVNVAGTFRFTWAQATSDADDTTVQAGSTLEVRRSI